MGKKGRSSPSYGGAKKKRKKRSTSSSSSSRPRRKTRKRSRGHQSSSASSPEHKRRRRRHRSGRPAAEKGGREVKLFVGRLPREVTRQQLQQAFQPYGPVLEVFIISQQASSQLGCAFVRLPSLEQAQRAVHELHDKPVPESSLFNPLQVALAKGEAERLGLGPDIGEAGKKQDLHQLATSAGLLPVRTLVDLVKEGQRKSAGFKQKWRSFCEFAKTQGVKSSRPSKHPAGALAHFVGTVAFEYGNEPWFRSKFDKVPPRAGGMLGGTGAPAPFLGPTPPGSGPGPFFGPGPPGPPGPPPQIPGLFGPHAGPRGPRPPPHVPGLPPGPPLPPHPAHAAPPWAPPFAPGMPMESNIFRPPTATQSGNIFRPWGPPPGVSGGMAPPMAAPVYRQRDARSPSAGAEISDSETGSDSESGDGRPVGQRPDRPTAGPPTSSAKKAEMKGRPKAPRKPLRAKASDELSSSESPNEDVDIALV